MAVFKGFPPLESAGSAMPAVERGECSLGNPGFAGQPQLAQWRQGYALIEVANPFLSELTRLTGETSCLTEPAGYDMTYIARFVSSGFVPVHMPIGSRVPMYCTASGRAYLSALPQEEALVLIENSQRIAHTSQTLTDVEQILGILLISPAFIFPAETTVWISPLGTLLFSLGGGLILCALVGCDFERSFLPRVLAYLGTHSYSIYLWHLVVEQCGLKHLHAWTGGALSWYSVMAIYILGSLAVGILMTRLIEIPSLKLRDALFPPRA